VTEFRDSSDLAVFLDEVGMLGVQPHEDIKYFQSLKDSEDFIHVKAALKDGTVLVCFWDGEEWMPRGVFADHDDFKDKFRGRSALHAVPWKEAAMDLGEVEPDPVIDADPEMAKFEGGGQRSSDEGRPRFDMLFVSHMSYDQQVLTRAALRMEEGARKYGARNFEEFQDAEALERARASLLRHTIQLVNGETDEDHAAAVIANVVMLSSVEKRVRDGLE
jgi:hypothetical protein